MCEDTSLFENDAQGHEFRLSLVDLRYFNPRTAEWEKTQNVELSSGKASTVAFKSKIFGTFSADMLLLPPDTIDFSAVFLNFAERLRSNPYALTVILCLWAILILIAIGLRRMDIQDEALWNYLPLVDNNPWNTAGYYMTVSTALRSSRNLTSTPYFNMVGSEGDTGARILNDGVRKNFRRGTTSHFYMTTPSHLGNLKRMTVWHDNEGTSPKWLLAKIVVQDLTDNKRYAFVCGKWMALDREDGKVWKRLKAQDEQTIDSHLLFSELSLRQMFDDNLWFSISTRPHFSRFNRVQRLWTIGALLFLSMIVSAMFYNTPAGKENSIKMGPFTFSYKQVYVGFVAAVLAVIPAFAIMTVFRKRSFRYEERLELSSSTSGGEKAKPARRLPWWTIFIAYGLVVAAILSSSMFVFLYSLDWGPDITLQWLLAFFIGTLQSVAIIEPLKAVALAGVFTFCFSRGGRKSLVDVPAAPKPTVVKEYDIPIEKQWHNSSIPDPEDVQEISEIDKNGDRLKLDRRLSQKLKTWSVYIGYVMLILILCSHNFIEVSYRQSSYLKSTLEPKTKIGKVDDIWTWFDEVFIPKVFPKYSYNGRIRVSYLQKFCDDEYLYRMGLVRIRQVRSNEKCKTFEKFVGYVKCTADYSTSTEETREFCKGWKPYSDTCFNENDDIDYTFKYFTSEDTEAVITNGEHAIYGSGGYYIDIGPKQSAAFRSIADLRTHGWINNNTRAVFVTFMGYNGNSNIFSYVNVLFELPPFGGITVDMHVSSANLYPYNTAWDYIVLFCQLIFIVVVIVRLVLLVKNGVVTKGKVLCTLTFWATLFDITVCVVAIVCYIIRLDGTITAVDKIAKNPRQHVSIELASVMDSAYLAAIGVVCFNAIISLLSPLTFNYHFHLFKVFLCLSRNTLLSLCVGQAIVLVAFATVVYMFFNMDQWELRNMYSTLLFLYRVALGMFKVKHGIKFLDASGILIFTIFGVCVSVITINLFVSILNDAFGHAQVAVKKNKKHQFDTELNKFLYWKLGNFLQALTMSCGKTSTDAMSKYTAPEEETSDRLQRIQTMKSFENFVFNKAADVACHEQQLLRTYLNWSRRLPKKSHLLSTCSTNTDETTITYYDRSSNFTLALVFPTAVSNQDVLVHDMDVIKAKMRNLYPCDKSSVPLSKMFKVKTNAKLRKKNSVQVLVVDTKPTNLPELPAFIVSSHDMGKTWEATAASPASRVTLKHSPCVSAMIRACPTHLMAISCELWPNVPDHCMDRLEMHTISPGGGTIRLRCNNRVVIAADKHSVDEDVDICVLEEEWSPAPIITITATEDIARPLILSIPLNMLDRGENPKELIILVKEGDLKWQKAPCKAFKEHGSIIFTINHLNRRVAKKILVKRSEMKMNLSATAIPDHYLRTAVTAVCNSKLSRKWRYLGKSLGIPVIYLDCVDRNNAPLCSEEKCSFVLHEWCVRNPEVTVKDLDKCLQKLGFPQINRLEKYI
ncbi:polycystin-1-like protein 2 isoform X2 [Argopecten irradians]|uniref:polycystin-1-like protein 2 isoform X2 n=1 Tax=Argopecten irradians TaxID=31199 RepID=UPI0037131C3F